jgi:predicted component of type VI protein secretion system
MMIQGNDSFRLIVRRGPQPNQSFELNRDSITLGRDITNEIVVNDPEVSRHHMRLTRGTGGFTIEDLGSTNGTFINGQRLTAARPLRPGDMIGLGETVTLVYEPISNATIPGGAASIPPGVSQPMPSQPSQSIPPSVSQPYQPSGQMSQPIPPSVSQPYQPPAQPAPSQPYQPSGYNQPAQQGFAQPQSGQFAPQAGASQQYGSPYGQPMSPAQPTQMPAGSGYGDYDPYALRDDNQSSTTRIIAIGCVALSLFCCCGTIASAVLVDQLCLYSSLPFVYDILRALGYIAVCS